MTESGDRPVFRDRRRIDPETGELREPQQTAAPEQPQDAVGDEHVDPALDPDLQPEGSDTDPAEQVETAEPVDRAAELETSLAERTLDLQRLQADYVNYKRRVDRDRELVRDSATASVLTALLPVLDDLDRAREHGELEGGFKAVADSLNRTVSGLGLERYGEVGDGFDPRIHEALMHAHADDIDGPTCTAILQPGYRIGERIIRPARVAVAEPGEPAGASAEPAHGDGS
ncbi:MAG: nucleotide exchange factor GrpE [Nocardioidaceae bacterium]